MTTKSFKQMIQAGEIKRADAMKVLLDDIHEEPGFNLRTEGEDLEASIRELGEYIAGGGIVPPLEVRVRPEGGVWVVDGHRRRRGFRYARDVLGAPVEYINIVAFTGNDADRVARIITSQEGRKLEPLEIAQGYKRLAAFGKTPDEIAAMVRKTRQHVDQLLILASANTDVQQLVKDGKVAGATAVQVVREHGESAGQVLREELDKAAKQGKAKVTAGTIKGKGLPAKVTKELVDAADYFVGELQELPEIHSTLQSVRAGNADKRRTLVALPAIMVLEILDAMELVKEARDKAAKRQAERQAQAAQTDMVPA